MKEQDNSPKESNLLESCECGMFPLTYDEERDIVMRFSRDSVSLANGCYLDTDDCARVRSEMILPRTYRLLVDETSKG